MPFFWGVGNFGPSQSRRPFRLQQDCSAIAVSLHPSWGKTLLYFPNNFYTSLLSKRTNPQEIFHFSGKKLVKYLSVVTKNMTLLDSLYSKAKEVALNWHQPVINTGYAQVSLGKMEIQLTCPQLFLLTLLKLIKLSKKENKISLRVKLKKTHKFSIHFEISTP